MSKYNIQSIISTDSITFMKDLNDFMSVSPKGKYKYFKTICFDIVEIKEFIHFLENDSIYIVIPFISNSGKLDDPLLILSRQFLVTDASNIITIRDYIWKQYTKAIDDFNIDELDNYRCYFKFRKIELTRTSKLK